MTKRKKCANNSGWDDCCLPIEKREQHLLADAITVPDHYRGLYRIHDPVIRTMVGYLHDGCDIDQAISRSVSPLATKEELQELVNDALRLAGKPVYSFESLPEEPDAKPQAYYDKALENATQAVRSCHKGNRQNELYRKAFSMGCFCGEGHLDSQTVEKELLLAYPGKNAKKALATIRRGLKRGARNG